jgi:protein-S-isoprenylcysteine O-methyltransferase Ste14
MSAAPDDARAVPIAPTRWLPPRFLWLFLALGAAAHFALGGPVLLRSLALGPALFAGGIALALWGSREFAAAGTTILPTERTARLVESGPFRWSRNPMYLGLVVALGGAALALGTPGPWLAPLALALVLRFRFVANEERALEATLGAPYLDYTRRVRRWL